MAGIHLIGFDCCLTHNPLKVKIINNKLLFYFNLSLQFHHIPVTVSISLQVTLLFIPITWSRIIFCYSGAFFIGGFMYAHYFAEGETRVLIISSTPKPVGVRIPVGSQAEAEAYTLQYGAKRWNF